MSLQLVLCLIITLTVACQCLENGSVTNGNVVCMRNGTLVADSGNNSACYDANYNSAERFRLFSIDCCNQVAQESRRKFSAIFQSIKFGSLINAAVSYQTNCFKTVFKVIPFVFTATGTLPGKFSSNKSSYS